MSIANVIGRPPPSFTTQRTMDGFAVIDVETGRPLDERPTFHEAHGVAVHLTQVAKRGPKALAKALRG